MQSRRNSPHPDRRSRRRRFVPNLPGRCPPRRHRIASRRGSRACRWPSGDAPGPEGADRSRRRSSGVGRHARAWVDLRRPSISRGSRYDVSRLPASLALCDVTCIAEHCDARTCRPLNATAADPARSAQSSTPLSITSIRRQLCAFSGVVGARAARARWIGRGRRHCRPSRRPSAANCRSAPARGGRVPVSAVAGETFTRRASSDVITSRASGSVEP